jgi:glycosyltransferase involved in cell wall biosynthesis
MRIACIASSAVPSNTANSIQMMKACAALAEIDGPVHLWVPGAGRADWPSLAKHYGLEQQFEVEWLKSVSPLRRYDFALRTMACAQVWKAELIYTWMLQAAVLALGRGWPVILEMHDRPTGRIGPWLFQKMIHSSGKKRLLVITEALRLKLAAEVGGLRGQDVQIAPNGTDLKLYMDLPDAVSARKQLGFAEQPTVVYSGHLYAGRGMQLLVGLAQAFPSVAFIWVGGRLADVETWREQLSRQGIENVRLTGFIPNQDLPLYQAAGDVLLMPYERSIAGSSGGNSVDICSPMKMFDYMAAGRAILTSDLPVLHEVLNRENAVFCLPENLAAWSEALGNLLSDPDRRRRLGEQARLDAERYTWRGRAEKALDGFVNKVR